MKILEVLMTANLVTNTAFADRSGGGGSAWRPEWPHNETLFSNEYVKKIGLKKEVWFGECHSKKGEEYPISEKASIMALGVFPTYKSPNSKADFAHTKFYVYPVPVSAKQYVRIMNTQGDPNQGEELYPEAESLVSNMRSRYEADFKFELRDKKGKATLMDDGTWQWYEQYKYDHNSASFTLQSFSSAFSTTVNDRPILYLSVVHHNPLGSKVSFHCIFGLKRGPLSMVWW